MRYITESEQKDFENMSKVGLIATVDSEGEPHISLISTLKADGKDKLVFGEFIEGLSKEFLKTNKKAGFLILDLSTNVWTGKMDYESTTTEGDDMVWFNSQPLYRYNTYCGINKVHYCNLVDISEKQKLKIGSTLANVMKVGIKRSKFASNQNEKKLKPWGYNLLKGILKLAFVSYVGNDGYPVIIPAIQLRATDENTIITTNNPYKNEFSKIPKSAKVAVYAMNLKMQTILVKGKFNGFENNTAKIDIERVYNSMPMKHGYIYPRTPNKAVKNF